VGIKAFFFSSTSQQQQQRGLYVGHLMLAIHLAQPLVTESSSASAVIAAGFSSIFFHFAPLAGHKK